MESYIEEMTAVEVLEDFIKVFAERLEPETPFDVTSTAHH